MQAKSPAFGSMILIGGVIVMIFALVGVVISFAGIIESTYLDLILVTPGFGYEVTDTGESGNEMFDTYVQMRYIAVGVMIIAFIYAGIARVLESTETEIVRAGTSNKILSKGVLFLLVILVFPPFWDGTTLVIEDVSRWILNPLYSFDEQNPCPADYYDSPSLAVSKYHDSPYIPDHQKTDNNIVDLHGHRYEEICKPDFKVRYVFGQMLRLTHVPDLKNSTGLNIDSASNWMGELEDSVQQGKEGAFTNIFLGLTKALVGLQIFIMALIIGIMTDMLTAMVVAGLPIFLMLSLIPKGDEIANKLIDAIPALMLIPLMSSVILVIGAGAILQTPQAGGGFDHVHTWITAIGVVFFAVTLSVLMVPLLKSSTQVATQVVSSAVQSAAIVTGMAATGGVGGMARNRGKGGFAMLKGGLAGFGGGLLQSHGSVGMVPGLGGGLNPAAVGHGMQSAAHGFGGGGGPQFADKAQQNSAIDGMFTSDPTANRAPGFVGQMGKSGITDEKGTPLQYDHTLTKDENAEYVNESIDGLNTKRITPAQTENIASWKGKINTAMEQENPTQADMDSIVSSITSADRSIDPNVASKRAIKEMSERRNIDAKDLRNQIKLNTKNVDGLDSE